MKEVTRVMTVEITDIIYLDDNESMLEDTPEWRRVVEKMLEDVIDADNILITNVQDFEMDVEDCQDCKE